MGKKTQKEKDTTIQELEKNISDMSGDIAMVNELREQLKNALDAEAKAKGNAQALDEVVGDKSGIIQALKKKIKDLEKNITILEKVGMEMVTVHQSNCEIKEVVKKLKNTLKAKDEVIKNLTAIKDNLMKDISASV